MTTDSPKSFGNGLPPGGPASRPDPGDAGEPIGSAGRPTPVVLEDFERAGTDLTPGWRWLLGAVVFYLVCLTIATWPAIPRMATELPSKIDPLSHIWTMRWNKACLLAGKLPFHCPDIQYPVGAALGTLPPMHLQTLLYVPLSFVFANDVLCYNIIRTVAFLLTGVGTMLLVWNVIRDRWVALVGGMLAMLSQPMVLFSQVEIEQITVGWFPIFLIAWFRWVDRPSGRGLAAAAFFYLLVAMSAPYFGVFTVFPATLYVAWRWADSWRSGQGGWAWFRERLAWFAGFAAITAPLMVVLFSNQIWALRHGVSLTRPDWEFTICRVPAWTYLVPSPVHRLSWILPFDTFVMKDFGPIAAYLGVVTIGLIAYAAVARVRFARRGFWWAVFLMLVVLSLGAHAWVFGYDVSMPAAWLKKYFIGFRMVRVPARFCLFAAVGGAVVASAGLHHLLGRIKSRAMRGLVLGVLTVVAVLDLTSVPYPTTPVPPVPPCYAFILGQDPHATIADIPHFNDGAYNLPSLAAYWQSHHGAKTTAGYTAFNNGQQNNLMGYVSPFHASRLADPNFLAEANDEHFEIASHVDFKSYVWLYLTVHKIRYVVFHHTAEAFPEAKIYAARTEAILQEALVYNDAQTAVFDREKLSSPTQPVLVYDQGWSHRVLRHHRPTIMVNQNARVWAYNPNGGDSLTLTLDVAGHKSARNLVLQADGADLIHWSVPPSQIEPLASPPFQLSPGLHELTLASDGADKPSRTDAHIEGDKTPFSLWVSGISLGRTGSASLAGRQIGDRVIR